MKKRVNTLFNDTGEIVLSAGVVQRTRENKDFAMFVLNSITEYKKQDWGIIDVLQRMDNDINLEKKTGRIVAKYVSLDAVIFIVTDSDRLHTTVFFPSEY